MSIGPSHIYTKEGVQRGVAPNVLQRALEHALPLQKKGLPPILSLKHIEHYTGVDWKYLRQIVARQSQPYRTFLISKRSGGKRKICVPETKLRLVQSWINQKILSYSAPHWRSYAYSPGCSILDSAREHCGCKWLVKVDIDNFFESIDERQVQAYFRSVGYQPLISLELARLCTLMSRAHDRGYKNWQITKSTPTVIRQYSATWFGYLPQGASTSPMLSNLVNVELDETLSQLAISKGFVYTRYADDMAFSSSDSLMSREDAHALVQDVYRQLRRCGYKPNKNKTVIAPPGAKKIVQGLLVDTDRPRLTKSFRKRIDYHLWAISKYGLKNHSAHLGFASPFGLANHVEGLTNFALMIDPPYGEKSKTQLNELLSENLEPSRQI